MRAALSAWPPPLLRRWVLTIAAGVGFLLVGVAVWLAAGDRMMLILSSTAFLLALVRAVLLFRCFTLEDYAQAVEKYGKLADNECFGYVPLLALGGKEDVEHLQKVKTKEHIAVITQLTGGV